MYNRTRHITSLLGLLFLTSSVWAQTAKPHARILDDVDESATVALSGNVHRLAATNPSTAADAGTTAIE